MNRLETVALEVELRQRNKMTLWDAQIYALDNYHEFRKIEYTNQDIYDYFIECVHPLEWHEENKE